ncbi:MAG: type 2 lanthipeptide synthetase LanM family protein [Egibacteraceae bacterium]
MESGFPFDIASHASNLSERRRIVDTLRERGSLLGPCSRLSQFELWKIEKTAGKLTGQALKQALRKGEIPKDLREGIVDLLTAYRLWEVNLSGLSEDERRLFAEIHDSWLPTYRSSLEDFNASAGKPTEDGWRHPDTYYGRFARACEPFLEQLERELSAACAQANQSLGMTLFCPQVVEDTQNHFIDRFELALAWAIETDINVYCARNKIKKSHGTSEDYVGYFDQTFADKDSYHRFYIRFPVLGRWLARVTRLLCDNGTALIERLRDDASELSDVFFGKKIIQFRSLKLGKSDYHAGGQTVARVEVELADSGYGWLIYKPRCLRSEIAMQGLLRRLATDSVLGFATRRIISKEAYGYEEFIPAERNHVGSREEVERIYEELGGYLGVFYALGGGDLHFENIIVADGHAFVCDCETVLGVVPVGQNRSAQSVLDSVYKTGLLEWPRTPTTEAVPTMKISGYAGGESYELPIPVPRVNDRRMSFELSVKHEIGVHVEPDAANRVYLADQLVRPEDFKDSIIKGFNLVYEWFQSRPSEAMRRVCELFEGTPVRFVNWSTQLYVQLLVVARHPTCLMDPLETDLVADRLREHLRKWDGNGVLVEREVSSLWQLDVPMFTTSAQGLELLHDYQKPLPVSFEVTPIQYARERITSLSSEDRLKQNQYIAASLSASEVHSPSFVASAVDYARQIGWQLCELARNEPDDAPWKSYAMTPEGISDIDIGADLYDGTAGIAFFLAYLDAIAPQEEFRLAAERALSHAIATYDREGIGVFRGVGGLVYLLTHLHHLWEDPKLLERAVELSRNLSARIEMDRDFDVLSGVAGVIPVMIGLADATSGEGLDCAHRCARHLLKHAEVRGNGLSWPFPRPGEAVANLTGFSHGASGIGWSLILLGCLSDRQDYIAAGRQAFTYEALHFDESEEDWYDLRTNVIAMSPGRRHFANAWCNGAAGIGLSRIASWAMLGKADEELLKESYLALAATLRNFRRLGNDTLCHGKCGNAELFLRFSQLKDEPAFQLEANVQAQVQWGNFETVRDWHFGGGDGQVFAGLMLGLSGVGMQFLRLAHPERVPSSLLLDPPLARS